MSHEQVPVTRDIMRKWSATMKRLRPNEHTVNVTERDKVCSCTLYPITEFAHPPVPATDGVVATEPSFVTCTMKLRLGRLWLLLCLLGQLKSSVLTRTLDYGSGSSRSPNPHSLSHR